MCCKRTIQRKRRTPLEAQHEAEKAAASASIKRSIKERYKSLGKTSLHEWIVIILFLILVVLWIVKAPLFLRGPPKKYVRKDDVLSNGTLKLIHTQCSKVDSKPSLKLESGWGWARFFGDKCDDGYIHDYVPTLLVCFLMFILPKDKIYYKNILRGGLDAGMNDPVLPLDFVAKNAPWGPLFLLGGGFALAGAISTSGLGGFLKYQMNSSDGLKALDDNSILAICFGLVAILTSIASNTAVAAIMAPVLLSLAATINVPPLYLLVPPIVCASYAFMLPISTPPNAIVYDKGHMKQLDMLVPGFVLTIICNATLFVFTITWTRYMLGVDNYDGSCSTPPLDSMSNTRSGHGRLFDEDFQQSIIGSEVGLDF